VSSGPPAEHRVVDVRPLHRKPRVRHHDGRENDQHEPDLPERPFGPLYDVRREEE
jgi:hypothetical protein